MANQTEQQIAKSVEAMTEIAGLVLVLIAGRGPNGLPSGELYGRIMGHMSLSTYESMIDVLVRTGFVTRRGHLLVANPKKLPK